MEVCLVTGGRGFVGRHLVLKLLEAEECEVRILDLAPTLSLLPEELNGALAAALASGRVKYVSADLCKLELVIAACKGASVVFHVAAANPASNNLYLHYAVNVRGTRNVIKACVQERVAKLIYTSSASVVFNGLRDIKDGDERLPYPDKAMDFYTETKAQAESLVLQASGKGGLLTAALRPSGIFGPGDPVFLPTAVLKAQQGKLKYIIGSGENMMDWTYVENVAHAHVCAARALGPASAGKAYFVTNKEPRRFWDFMLHFVAELGYPRPVGKLPKGPILALAHVASWAQKLLAPFGVAPSDFTPSRIRIATTWRVFSSARAEQLLGYSPIVSLEEGVQRTLQAFQHLRFSDGSTRRGGAPTQVLSGGGFWADLLLWRDKRQSAAALLALLILYAVLFVYRATFVQLAANSALLALLLLFSYQHLHPYVSRVIHITSLPSKWEVSEEQTTAATRRALHAWRQGLVPLVRRIISDYLFVLQVVAFLSALSWCGAHVSLSTFVGSAAVGLCLLPVVLGRSTRSDSA